MNQTSPLEGRSILLIITGGIAAYKALELIREFKKRGAALTPVLSKGAQEFITPMAVAALSGSRAYHDLFDLKDESEMGHIELSRSADLIVLAPATANIIAKMAMGIADDLPSTLLLATDTPVMIAPAMNMRMWEHAATQRNIAQLQGDGIAICGPVQGDMACGEYGFGRMCEPIEIADFAQDMLRNGALKDHHVIVTSGPTHEQIDPVRYIANNSSGLQGAAIANALVSEGAQVTFITGPASAPMPMGCKIIKVQSAQQMYDATHAALPADIVICAAAVADWRVDTAAQKIKKTATGLPALEFHENPDILASIAQSHTRPKLVIGFAAETDRLHERAQEKLTKKGCDWILANDVSAQSGIMGGDHNRITKISAQAAQDWPRMSKIEVGKRLTQEIIKAIT